MLDYKPNMVLSTQEFKVVGKRPIRPDGADKVTGRARYSADIVLPGMLYGKILRSPLSHARIKSIDTSAAEKLPGVFAIATSADLPQPAGKAIDLAEGSMVNPRFLSNNILAKDKVLYKGHAVAAVAAVNFHVAEQALALIKVDYEPLPVVRNYKEAMAANAPLLHERLATLHTPTIRAGGYLNDDDPTPGTNIANRFEFKMGDLEKGFQEAEVLVQREYDTVPVHQGYIEPHSATAQWQGDNLTIWSSSQGHFTVRDQTARVIGIPPAKVKAIPMEIGGGFGGKTLVYVEPVAAVLAKKAGRPVKVAMSRGEVFEGTGPTAGAHISIKLGCKKSGQITALEAHLIYEAGAFPGSPVPAACQCMVAPYIIPNAYVEGVDVVVNRPKSAAYRAPGAPAAAFAMEQAIDEMAQKLGFDPVDFRMMNGAKEGTRRATGPVFPRIGFIEVMQAVKDHPHYNTPLTGKWRGRGVAAGFWGNNTGPSSVFAVVNADGTVALTEGSPDIGGSRAAISQMFAEVLSLPIIDIKPQVGDTDSIGFTSNTGGSSVTFKTGWAAYEAAQDVKRQVIQRAATIWNVAPDLVDYVDGVVQHKSDPELKMTFRQLAGRMVGTGGPIVGRAGVNPRGAGSAFAAHLVDVEVDPDTGKTTILRFTAIQDAGKAIHPSYVEGQIQGGAVQGIGWALNEEYVFNDQGHMVNSTFLDYRMPTSLDLPMIDTVIVEVTNPGHPFGVRGVGEVSIVPPMAAIANAIHNAIGVRMTKLPISPGAILEALWDKK